MRSKARVIFNKEVLRLAAISAAITMAIALLVCLYPIRWDKKALGPVLPQFNSSEMAHSPQILFVSKDNDWENGHYAQYGFDMIAFPHGKVDWMVFKEGWRESPWQARWMIDEEGNIYSPGGDNSWYMVENASEGSISFPGSASVIVSDPDTRAKLLKRWPSLSEDKVLLMSNEPVSFWESPRIRIGLSQFIRIFVLVFLLVVMFAFLSAVTGENGRGWVWLNLGLAVPSVLIPHTIVVYFLGKITSEAISLSFILEFVIAIGLTVYIQKKKVPANKPPIKKTFPDIWHSMGRKDILRPESLILAALLLLYISFSCLKLDFDGDMFTQYVPVAQYHYLAGSHDPKALMERFGIMTQATYPPGFPILISTLMWAGDLPKETPLKFGYQANLAIFLYRFMISILHLSFLLSAGGLFRLLQKDENSWGWLLPTLAIPLILPLFLGRPEASEVFLVPVVGFSILALLAGDELNNPLYTNLGLFFGGYGMFLKKEGFLIFVLIVMPWYLAGRLRSSKLSLRAIAINSTCLLIGISPFLFWKLGLNSLHIPEYFFYENPSLAKLAASGPLLKGVIEKAIKILLANNYWVALFLIFPLAVSYDWLWCRRWKQACIPLGAMAYIFSMTFVYLFSRHPEGAAVHMDVSYERILAVGILSVILYGAKTIIIPAKELQRNLRAKECAA